MGQVLSCFKVEATRESMKSYRKKDHLHPIDEKQYSLIRLESEQEQNSLDQFPNEYLFDFFQYESNLEKVAIIYDDGRNFEVKLTYEDLNHAAIVIEKKLLHKGFSGFVGVSFSQNHLYPCIQIGIMRSGQAIYSISDDDDFQRTVTNARNILGLQYMIIDEEVFASHDTWILENAINQDFIEIMFHGESEILRIIQFPIVATDNLSKEIKATPRFTAQPFEFAYAMQTTGTTGDKKLVLVSHASIVPNISDFISRVWKLTPNDVVFGCSPPTFDPSIVDLFCALGSGGCILFVPKNVKLDGSRLGTVLLKHKVTVLQTTPSFLRKFGNDLKSIGYFTQKTTSLKILALGGEKCLSKEELKIFIDNDMYNSLRGLINLYGVTEMSCWASFGIIDLDDTDPRILIDQDLKDTSVVVELPRLENSILPGIGEIIIKSETRFCTVIDHEGHIVFGKNTNHYSPFGTLEKSSSSTHFAYKTGDYGYCSLGNKLKNQKMEFVGRLDSIVKRSGVKIPLAKIEELALETGLIQTAQCVFRNDKIYLFVVPKLKHSSMLGLGRHVRANFVPDLYLDISPKFYPEFIVAVHSIPINENGKIDVQTILKYVENQNYPWNGMYSMAEGTIIKTLYPLWNFITGNRETPLKMVLKENFYEMGGSSAQATWFVENSFYLLNMFGTKLHEEYENQLLRSLNGSTFHGICSILKHAIAKQPLTAKVALVSAETVESFKSKILDSGFCITLSEETLPFSDSSSMKFCEEQESYYSESFEDLSSFEHDLQNVYVRPLRVLFSCEYDLRLCVDANTTVSLEGLTSGIVFVGSHSGHIIAVDCFELRRKFCQLGVVPNSAGVLWIRALPDRVESEVVINSEGSFVYIGCHDKKLYKLSSFDGSVIAFFSCDGSIRSKPAINNQDNFVVIIDDSNTLYCLRSKNLQLVWKKKFFGGIRSGVHPVIEADIVLVTTVRHGLTALSLKNGDTIWPWGEICNSCCTSPVIMKNNDGKRVVICGAIGGVDCKDVQTGDTLWHFDDKELCEETLQFSPIIHCCRFQKLNEVIIVSSDGRTLRLDSHGKKIHEIFIAKPECSPSILCSRTMQQEKGEQIIIRSCSLMYKPMKNDQFILYGLEDPEKHVCFSSFRMDEQNFSIVNKFKDCFVFGGRDNKLHVVFCEHVSRNS